MLDHEAEQQQRQGNTPMTGNTSEVEIEDTTVQTVQQTPAHKLIEVINDMPEDLMEIISPRSKTLKSFIKVPMIYLLFFAGLQSGLCIVFMKLVGELFQSSEAMNNVLLLSIITIFMVISAVS